MGRRSKDDGGMHVHNRNVWAWNEKEAANALTLFRSGPFYPLTLLTTTIAPTTRLLYTARCTILHHGSAPLGTSRVRNCTNKWCRPIESKRPQPPLRIFISDTSSSTRLQSTTKETKSTSLFQSVPTARKSLLENSKLFRRAAVNILGGWSTNSRMTRGIA
jgi:hypothetical protein